MFLTQSQLNSCFLPDLGSFHTLAPASCLLKEVPSARQGSLPPVPTPHASGAGA